MLGVVLGELQIPALPRHAHDDVTDRTPRVEPLVKELQLGRGRRYEREPDGGAEEAGALVGHARRFDRRRGLTPGTRPRRPTRWPL